MTAAAKLAALAWPPDRLGELLEELGQRYGLAGERRELPPSPAPEHVEAWIERAASFEGLEAEAVEVLYRNLESFVRRAGPALVRLPAAEQRIGSNPSPRFLALLGPNGFGGRRVAVLRPDLTIARVEATLLCEALRHGLEAPLKVPIDHLLDRAGTSSRRRRRARRALLERSLGAVPVSGCWILRLSAGAAFARQLQEVGLARRVLVLVAAHMLQFGLWIFSWYLIGRGALGGEIDPGWLVAWALLLATVIPVRLFSYWWQGRLVIDFGILLKRRLLAGALRLPLDDIRRRGSGELLGRVIESEVFEALILSGGFLAVTGGVEVVMVLPVLRAGAGGWLHAAAFAAWIALGAVLAYHYHRHLGLWTAGRLELTLDLVERMVGYRTRLAQQLRERWHAGEDGALEAYLARSRPLDTAAALLNAGFPRGWLVAGTLALAPAFVLGSPSVGELAVALGGNLLAFATIAKLAAGAVALATAHVGWRQIAPLFVAAARPEELGEPAATLAALAVPAEGATPRMLLEADNLSFRYPGQPARVLRGAALCLERGDRVLLEGPSGSGKSTLIAILEGLRPIDSGLMLLDGLDRRTLGDAAWRARLAAAPQFNENHVLLGTLAFNLLLGRRWPPSRDDLEEAEVLCREIGLGELIERMPNGIHQMVGETGWQLSHGERSRLYLARALLQEAEIVILDESFAALDPESLRRALKATLERAPTLVVVAHP